MGPSWWAVAVAVLCTMSAANAQTTSLDREVKAIPGREVRVGTTELPVSVAFYQPKADSANDDRFELEVSFAAGRKQIQRFHVTISSGASERQRI